MQPGYKVCPICAEAAALQAGVCLKCGHVFSTQFPQGPNPTQSYQPPQTPMGPPAGGYYYRPPASYYSATHNPTIAVLLSLLCVIGAGQFYNRQYLKAAAVLAGGILLTVFTGGLGGLPVWIVAAYDSYAIANKIRMGRPVGPWESF